MAAKAATKPVDTEVSATPTVKILAALDFGITRIRSNTPDVPHALAPILSTGKGKFHGQFQASAWIDTDSEHKGSARHELVMATESLGRSPELVLTTLIHECAHAVAHATDVAESMGLVVETDSKIGHVTTGLNAWATTEYADVIERIRVALITYRKPTPKKETPKTTIKVSCKCVNDSGNPFSVTVPIKWFDEVGENMWCSECESALIPV